MKIKCIAIDDEPLALDKIRTYIERVSYLQLLSTFDNGLDAMGFMKDNKVDLIFLDIQMDQLTGIQMLETLSVKPKVVLTTAYDAYALKGYELDVTDYLLKPISFQRFLMACEKVYKSLSAQIDLSMEHHATMNAAEDPTHFFVKSGSSTQKIKLDDILFVEGMKDYLRIWTINDRIMTLLSFKKLEESLPEHQFIRIHKSYMVAINKIEHIERNRVKIGKELLPVGESYRRKFNATIEQRKLG